MANRRMLSKEIVNTDFFTAMPASAQALYLHLVVDADDEGFVANTRNSIFKANASPDDLKLLIAKRFIIPMSDTVYVVKHWFQQNSIDANHFKRSEFNEFEERLWIKQDGSYTTDPDKGVHMPLCIANDGLDKKYKSPKAIANANKMCTNCEPSIGKVSIGKNNKDKDLPVSATASKDDDMAEAEKIIAKYKGKAE